MVTRRTFLGMVASSALGPVAASATDRDIEPDFLRPYLHAAQLPALADRIPDRPRIVKIKAMGREPGQYGGTVRTIISGQSDLRFMTIYGYARLIGYDEKLNLQPDILEDFQSEEDRIFTLKLRPGHKWSDGAPFTADDFRYWWEDVILNKQLTPGGGALELRPKDHLPKFEVIDQLTVRYTWDVPNPNFLSALAAPQPLVIPGPSH